MKIQRKIVSLAVIFGLVLTIFLLDDVLPATALPTIQSTESGQISGNVTSDDGVPLDRTWITAYNDIDGDGHWDYVRGESTEDGDSYYIITDLPPGRYRVGFEADTYYPQFYNDAAAVESATDVIVVAGVTTPNINTELRHMARIRGRVTDNRGEPLAGITVYAYEDPEGDGSWEWEQADNTARDGSYSIDGLERGIFRVGFSAYDTFLIDEYYDNVPTVELATDIFVDKRDTIYNIDAVLDGPIGRIRGQVADETGLPIDDASVSVLQDFDQDGVWQSVKSSSTEADGSYVVPGLPDGVYRIRFTDITYRYKQCPYLEHATQYYNGVDTLAAATDVVIAAGAIVNNIDAQLILPSTIQGRVTDHLGNPANVMIRAYGETEPAPCLSTGTNIDGSYSIGVSSGIYRIHFYTGIIFTNYVNYTWEYYDNAASPEAATPIIVASQSTVTNIDAELAPPGTIRGRVVIGDDPSNYQGVAQIRVTAYQDRTGNGYWQAVSSTTTDAAGYYGVPGVGGYDSEFNEYSYRIGFADLRTPPLYHPEFFVAAGYPENGYAIGVGESLEVWVSDLLLSAYGTVNYAPLARADYLPVLQSVTEGPWIAFYSVLANDVDTEGALLHAELVQAPSQGTLTLDATGFFTYTPTVEPWSSATFTYRASDGVNTSEVVSVTFVLTTDQSFLPIIRDGELVESDW